MIRLSYSSRAAVNLRLNRTGVASASKKAIESFSKAIELDATNIQAQFNIGIVLFHDLNDKNGAIEAWGKVASMQPDYQVSTGQNILQLIENLKENK